jgi:hypothetical protein
MDLDDALSAPRSIVSAVLRALWWLAWDFGVETIGWSIGWGFYRLATAGRFPCERLGDQDEASSGTAFLVEATGLVILALAIWLVTSRWPD